MSGVALFVILFGIGCMVCAALGVRATRGREAEMMRHAGNLKRIQIARKAKEVFYTYEAPDGSLLWRRISTR